MNACAKIQILITCSPYQSMACQKIAGIVTKTNMIIEHACPFLDSCVNTDSTMNDKNWINSDTGTQGRLKIRAELITAIQKEATKHFRTGKKAFSTSKGVDILINNGL